LVILSLFAHISLSQDPKVEVCENTQNDENTCMTQCGILKMYWYSEVKIYSGPIEKDCQVTMENLKLHFKEAYPESNDTRFVSRIGLPLDEPAISLPKVKEEYIYVIGLDNQDLFVWPYLDPEIPLKVQLSDGTEVTITAIADSPRIFSVSGFFSSEELSHMLNVAKLEKNRSMNKSTVGSFDEKVVSTTRTSSHTWIGRETRHGNDSIVVRVEKRFHELGRSRDSLAESIQVVWYDKSQHYFVHRDCALPRDVKEHQTALKGGNNRMVTVLSYLNDVEEGGQTAFPYLSPDAKPINRGPPLRETWPSNLCELKDEFLLVTPEAGKIVLFYSMTERGNYINFNQSSADPVSSHMGCHVKKGEKFVMNVWLRNKRVNGLLF